MELIVITRWFNVSGRKMLAENSAAASVSPAQQVIFMDCLQDFHIWHSKEVCNFYTLPSSLFSLQKSHSKGQLHSVLATPGLGKNTERNLSMK